LGALKPPPSLLPPPPSPPPRMRVRMISTRPAAARMAAEETLYDTLGVGRDASQAEIRRAYLRLSKMYHPDSSGRDDTHEKFSRVNSAYRILSDAEKRGDYDAMLRMNSAGGGRGAGGGGHSHENFYNHDFSGPGGLQDTPRVDVDGARMVMRRSGAAFYVHPQLALFLARMGWPQHPGSRKYNPVLQPLTAILLALSLLGQVYWTYRSFRRLDPAVLPQNFVARARRQGCGKDDDDDDGSDDAAASLQQARESVVKGSLEEAFARYAAAARLRPGDAEIERELKFVAVEMAREARKGELRSGLQFGRHSDFIQPSELEKDRRQWFQGSVLGASAALAYLTHRYVTKPGLVVGNLGFALQFWMNVGVSAALTPVVSWVFLPYPNSPSYDLLHGNMHVICRDVGAGYGLAFVAANSGLKLRAAPQLFLGFLLGRFAGHATAGFLFPKNIKGEVDDSYRITFLKAESDPSPPKARAAAVADQSAPDATEDASSNTGLKQHGTGYEDEAVGDEWERKMQEKAKRITSSNAGGQPQP